jgi:CRP-like cAMP-binding protein
MSASLCSYSARQQVLLEGRWLGAAVLVVKGSLRAVRRTDNARELTLETFRPGDLIADAVLFPDGSMPGDGLVAAETSLLLFIPRDEFLTALSSVPQAALSLIRDLERRLNRVKAAGLGACHLGRRKQTLPIALQSGARRGAICRGRYGHSALANAAGSGQPDWCLSRNCVEDRG